MSEDYEDMLELRLQQLVQMLWYCFDAEHGCSVRCWLAKTVLAGSECLVSFCPRVVALPVLDQVLFENVF